MASALMRRGSPRPPSPGSRPLSRRNGRVGLADYTRADWERIVLTSMYRHMETWEQWPGARDDVMGRLAALGVPVRLLRVEAAAYIAWLQARGLDNLRRCRPEYEVVRNGRA